jgi:hypothetical protein
MTLSLQKLALLLEDDVFSSRLLVRVMDEQNPQCRGGNTSETILGPNW